MKQIASCEFLGVMFHDCKETVSNREAVSLLDAIARGPCKESLIKFMNLTTQ